LSTVSSFVTKLKTGLPPAPKAPSASTLVVSNMPLAEVVVTVSLIRPAPLSLATVSVRLPSAFGTTVSLAQKSFDVSPSSAAASTLVSPSELVVIVVVWRSALQASNNTQSVMVPSALARMVST
jgi:hypothetical protein